MLAIFSWQWNLSFVWCLLKFWNRYTTFFTFTEDNFTLAWRVFFPVAILFPTWLVACDVIIFSSGIFKELTTFLQLSVHPVDDSLIQYIENLAFKHFKENLPNAAPPVTANQTIITALYAEVIGVLAQTRFQSIRKRFMQEYKENVGNTQVLLNIIIGLKYIRIKVQ